jgi:hypothetical protein
LIRFQESRGFGSYRDEPVEKDRSTVRTRGSITMDNKEYGRYCGEIMIIRRDLCADERVNVIGRVDEKGLELIDNVGRNTKFALTEK